MHTAVLQNMAFEAWHLHTNKIKGSKYMQMLLISIKEFRLLATGLDNGEQRMSNLVLLIVHTWGWFLPFKVWLYGAFALAMQSVHT